MRFEELIYKRLSEYGRLAEHLAEYGGKPAVFYQTAPDDKQDGWGEEQYPRIVYTMDMMADEERKSAGVLQVDLYCDEEKTEPERIIPFIRDCLTNLIVHPEGASHYAFAWSSTEMFTIEERTVDVVRVRVIGATVRFDILEYGDQYTSNPDPAEAVNAYLKRCAPEGVIIGLDKIDPYYEPSYDNPAFFTRITSYQTDYQTYALTWINCAISVHVIVPQTEGRTRWVRYLVNCFNRSGEVMMLDDSPMLLNRVSVDNTTDYLTRGQITLEARYSLPRVDELMHPLSETSYRYNYEEG